MFDSFGMVGGYMTDGTPDGASAPVKSGYAQFSKIRSLNPDQAYVRKPTASLKQDKEDDGRD